MPRKVFVAGEILTAADVNANLMDQAVMVFDDSTARGSAIPSPSEGMVTYLKDTDALEKYTTAWEPVDTAGIIQVVSTRKTDTFSASVGTGAISGDVTGLTATITPTSATSKLLVFVSATVSVGSTEDCQVAIYRDSALSVFSGNAASNRKRVAGVAHTELSLGGPQSTHFSFLDDASSTSATTFSVRLAHTGTATQTVFLNRGFTDTDSSRYARGASSITIMEVAN